MMELEQTDTLLDKPSVVHTVQKEVIPRGGCVPAGRASVPRAMRRASWAVLVIHLVLLVVNTFSWSQLASCGICVVTSTMVLLLGALNKNTFGIAGVLYAVGCVLDVGQFVGWLGMAYMVHRNNLARHPADRVPVVLLGFVLVPAAAGACCCAYGVASAFDAGAGWDQHHRRQPPDHGGGLGVLPFHADMEG